jgi:hypothetical protein
MIKGNIRRSLNMKKALIILSVAFIFLIAYAVVVIPQETQQGQQGEQQQQGEVQQEQGEVQQEAAPVQAEPSSGTIKIEKHWSRYVYPEEVPANVKIHIIERGDTLWDLAGKYLKNPFLWPQIWEANKYIKDAHWIYPQDPLIIPIPTEVPEEKVAAGMEEIGKEQEMLPEIGKEEEQAAAGEEAMPHEFKFYEAKKRQLVLPTDLKCSSYIVKSFVGYKYRILAAERQMHLISFSTNDIVYIDAGESAGIKAGDKFLILHPDNPVEDPVTFEPIGTLVRKAGVLTVIATQDYTSTAQITETCFPISIGDFLEPYQEPKIPVVTEIAPIDRYMPIKSQLRGRIIYSEAQTVGDGHLVYIDRGTQDGVEVGSKFLIYRNYKQGYYGEKIKQDVPDVILGELIVIEPHENISTAKIIQSFDYIILGDLVALR